MNNTCKDLKISMIISINSGMQVYLFQKFFCPKLSRHKQCLKNQPYGTNVVEWNTLTRKLRDYLPNTKRKTLLNLNQNQNQKNKRQNAHEQIFKTHCVSSAKGKPTNIFSMSDN